MINIFKNLRADDKRGVVLVITLIVMSIFLAVAIGFGVIIISDIRQAATVDNSMVAYFAADSGIEQNLFLLRKQENVTSTDDIASTTIGLAGSASNWSISSSTNYETTFFRQRIQNGQSAKLFFLGRESGSNAVKSISVDWNKSLDSPTKMQISFTRLRPESSDNVYRTDQNIVALATSTNKCFTFGDKDLQNQTSVSDYAVEIKALGPEDGYIDNLKVLGYESLDCTGSKFDSAISNITLVSEGRHGNATQRIIAHIPPRTPVSGIFSFVLFSYEDITKK